MKRTITSLAFFLSLWLPTCVLAMKLERVNNDLYATGPTVDHDFLSFKDAFAKGGIERLILVNGPGGDLWTGMQVARMVQGAQIKTVVSGFCMSACSLIFMAGQERAFGTGHLPRVTMVGIHGAHSKDTKQVNHQAMPQMYALYKQQMGENSMPQSSTKHSMTSKRLLVFCASGKCNARRKKTGRPGFAPPAKRLSTNASNTSAKTPTHWGW